MVKTSVRVRTNRWAIVSGALPIIGVACLALGILLLLAYPPPEGHSSPFFSAAAGPILLASTVGFFSGPLSLIAGIVAFRQIKKRKGEEKGKFLAWIGIVFGGVHVAVYVLTFYYYFTLLYYDFFGNYSPLSICRNV